LIYLRLRVGRSSISLVERERQGKSCLAAAHVVRRRPHFTVLNKHLRQLQPTARRAFCADSGQSPARRCLSARRLWSRHRVSRGAEGDRLRDGGDVDRERLAAGACARCCTCGATRSANACRSRTCRGTWRKTPGRLRLARGVRERDAQRAICARGRPCRPSRARRRETSMIRPPVEHALPRSHARITPVRSGEFDAIGALAHEISEVMGRCGSVGSSRIRRLYRARSLSVVWPASAT